MILSHFFMVPHRIVTLVFARMVYLDTSYKHMGWYGHDSLYFFGYIIFFIIILGQSTLGHYRLFIFYVIIGYTLDYF